MYRRLTQLPRLDYNGTRASVASTSAAKARAIVNRGATMSPNAVERLQFSDAGTGCRCEEAKLFRDVVVVTSRRVNVRPEWHCMLQTCKPRLSLDSKPLRVSELSLCEAGMSLNAAVPVDEVRELPRIELGRYDKEGRPGRGTELVY